MGGRCGGVGIAIVGMGALLPEAKDPQEFWANVLAARCAVRALRGGPWEWERLGLSPQGAAVEGFTPDWRALRIPPADAAAMNPAQLHVLEAGRQALAGLQAIPRDRTGIWLGATGLGWQPDTGMRVRLDGIVEVLRDACRGSAVDPRVADAGVEAARAELERRLRPASEEPVVNSAASIAAGRIATLFDLRGPHCAVDAGFASGLAALELACRALRGGTVDCALAGGVSELLSPAELVGLDRMGVLAQGAPRPFDVAAAGTAPGEGAVLFALKRLEDAVRDGDTVHAVVRGVGAGSDGARASMLAPSAAGQTLAARRALEEAQVGPESIGFLECHGTGTPLGDATELAALAEAYAGATQLPIGSAKSVVGHLRGAAGAVGLLRAVLALSRRTIPPQAGFARPCQELSRPGIPFSVPVVPSPFEPRAGTGRLRAGVAAASLGGICYHAILEAGDPAPARDVATGSQWREPLAVLGLGVVLPGARDVPEFWKALIEGRSQIQEVPPERWDADGFCDPDPHRLERSYTRLGAFVETPALEPRWRVPPASREAIDPAQLLALRAAEEAVAGARLEEGPWDRDRTGVFLGFMACQGRKLLAETRFHTLRAGAYLREALRARGVPVAEAQGVVDRALRRIEATLPPLDEDALPGWLGSVAAARVARRFGLRGPQLAIESACASTLAALQAAVQALRDGTCDTVLVGGAWADMQPEFYVGSCRFNALSASGSTPFDARASGFVPGEGAGFLVLRRLSDAERDGQRVHALVRGVGGSSDGRGKSILAPSAEGEAMAMVRALEDGGVAPALVDYVECHGTGTAAGDAAEIDACTRAYGRGRARPLRVGSVKANIGHLLAAAGAPALVKAVLAVREGLLPPSLNVERLNPAIDFAAGPIQVVTSAERWAATPGEPRRAGVSGFGLGGTNLHAILEEHRPAPLRREDVPLASPRRAASPPARILPVAVAEGRDLPECVDAMTRLAALARSARPGEYLDLLGTAQREATQVTPCRVAVVAADAAALASRAGLLAGAWSKRLDPSLLRSQGIFVAHGARLPVAVTFPGQGPQYPNMLRDALVAFPALGETLDAADRAYQARCGRALRPAFFTDSPAEYAQRDEDIHCAVFAVNVALYRLLQRYGLRPDALMGQSAGELAALVAAGTLSFEDGLAVVHERTASVLAIPTADPGKMVALACGADRAMVLAQGVPGYVALAADNGPEACILSGDARATPALVERAARAGIEATVLGVSHGYHSQLIAAARPRFEQHLAGVRFRASRVEVVSTVTGRPLNGIVPGGLVGHLGSQFVEPVRLRPAIEDLYARGIRLFVECGPKWPLTTFVGQILRDRPHVAIATLHPKVGEVEQLHRALACLYVHGAASLSPLEDPVTSQPTPVAAVASVAASSPSARPDLVVLLRGIRDLIDGYLASLSSHAAAALPTSGDPVTAEADPLPVATPAGLLAGAVRSAGPPAEAAAAAVPAPQAPSAPSRDEVQRALLQEYVRRTGYPEDMLDPHLDLEAELGIDTVKQVAALAAVRERFGVPPDPRFRLRDANTIASAVDWLAAHVAAGREPTAPGRPVLPAVISAPRPAPAAMAAATIPAASAGSATPRALPVAPARTFEAACERVRRLLLDEYARRTGYPEDMLDPHLDLEAELGIDTVKQVAALGVVREQLGLAPDPRFRLRDANTIAKAAEVLAHRLAGEPPPPSGPAPGGGAPRPHGAGDRSAGAEASALTQVERHREPAPPPAVAVGPTPLATVARLLEAILGAAGADVLELSGISVSGGASEAGEPPEQDRREPRVDERPSSSSEVVRLQAALGSAAVEATVRTGRREGGRIAAPPEILAAIAPARRGRAAGGPELRAALAPVLGQARGFLEWARSDGFMTAAGGARLPDGPAAARMGALLAAAAELASFAWIGLTGAPHALGAIEQVRILAVPEAGATAGLHIKMIAPDNGLWRADVRAVCGDTLVAEIRGLTGTPVRATSGGAGTVGGAADRAWQRFCRRMRGEHASEDVA